MTKPGEHRKGPDRRRQPRGGRRSEDQGEPAPLVLLVGDDGPVMSMAEAVLARLRFAVATSRSVEEALNVVSGIRPEVVVVGADAADRAREMADGAAVVVMTDDMRRDPEVLIPAIRQTLRAR
jgi:ActR/RegA family two-component response regulator